MKKKVELEIDPDGTIRTMYQDGIEQFAEDVGGSITTSCRASDVEWEDNGTQKGWTVRSAYDKELALRTSGIDKWVMCKKEGPLKFFDTRESALEMEQSFFWELLAPKKDQVDVKG